jgi:hypothetical protein
MEEDLNEYVIYDPTQDGPAEGEFLPVPEGEADPDWIPDNDPNMYPPSDDSGLPTGIVPGEWGPDVFEPAPTETPAEEPSLADLFKQMEDEQQRWAPLDEAPAEDTSLDDLLGQQDGSQPVDQWEPMN